MKMLSSLILFMTLVPTSAVLASAVTPTVTGKVQAVGDGVTKINVTLNGKTYTLTNHTKTDGGATWPQAGQQVTFELAPDGTTVIAVLPGSTTDSAANNGSNATHP